MPLSNSALEENRELQLDSKGNLKHFLHLYGMPRALLEKILDISRTMLDLRTGSPRSLPLLRGYMTMNLFFEDSTRTRTNFELAAKQLSANVINLDISHSSTSKGESLDDTIKTLESMGPRILVIRHHHSGAARHIAQLAGDKCGIINAGDGSFEHPTQSMLDMFTIQHYLKDFSKVSIAIIGDIVHSRVARSQIAALKTLGTKDIRLVSPPHLAPTIKKAFSLPVYTRCEEALEGCNIVSLLRVQKERIAAGYSPDYQAYFRDYGLTKARLKLARPGALVLHPGPINRGIEISNEVADGNQSVILKQVSFGVAIRMAVMSMIVSGQNNG